MRTPLRTSHGPELRILWRHMFLWQRSEVPTSTALPHPPLPPSPSCVGLEMIRVSHRRRAKGAVGTRSGIQNLYEDGKKTCRNQVNPPPLPRPSPHSLRSFNGIAVKQQQSTSSDAVQKKTSANKVTKCKFSSSCSPLDAKRKVPIHQSCSSSLLPII